MADSTILASALKVEFRRAPGLPYPILYSQEARGHVVTSILTAMVAMLFTTSSYERMGLAFRILYGGIRKPHLQKGDAFE